MYDLYFCAIKNRKLICHFHYSDISKECIKMRNINNSQDQIQKNLLKFKTNFLCQHKALILFPCGIQPF